MATTSDESNQPKNGRPRRRWDRSLLLVLVLFAAAVVGLEWLLSQRFKSKIVEVGGQLFVDDSNLASQSAFLRLRDRFFNRLTGNKDQRIHHIRFDGSNVDDSWLQEHRDEIENLSRWTELTLENSRVTPEGLAALRGISSVFTVDLSGTRLTAESLDHLATMPDLWNLDISDTGIPDDALARLRQFPALKSIILDASQATDSGIAYVGQISQLSTLCLVRPTTETIARLPHALSLTIREATISPQMITSLKSMDRLKKLTVIASRFSDCSSERLSAELPDCTINVISAVDLKRLKANGMSF